MHVSSLSSTLSLVPNSLLNLLTNNNNIKINNNNSYSFLNFNNWNWLLQFLITVLILGLGFLLVLRSTASKFFSAHNSATFVSSDSLSLSTAMAAEGFCAVCAKVSKRRCTGCRAVFYCSVSCQKDHWNSEHKAKCKELGALVTVKSVHSSGVKRNRSISLVPASGADNIHKIVNKVLFPYDEFVKLFNMDNSIFPPCGLLNCGNSCFANVVLQCLAHTRPLVAYLLQKGHRRDCRRNEWCFLCELELHMDRASRSQQPFSPINILSRLPSMSVSLSNGRQEDAHEFMRFAIDTMQSVCLDVHGGERIIHPKSQETTLIQHIFGGQLRSQVLCTRCNQVSNQYENMMDLTVEIQGDATLLEECLDQFTAKEWLHGDNMYKCDRCNDYVRASKHLTIHQAPNILTIALKRFQSGRFGKINKKISFPERLDISPFMSEERDGTDKYELYAVVVHVDMLNASFFGHYICYTKGFEGNWYRIDDCKVSRVDLDEVLSQGAYMLLYRRISARPKCLKTFDPAMQQSSNSLNCLEPSSSGCSLLDSAASKNQELDRDNTDSRVKHDPVGGLEDSHTLFPVSGPTMPLEVMGNGDALAAADTRRVFTSPICSASDVADVNGSFVVGVNASNDTACEDSATVPLNNEETNRELQEHRSEAETAQNDDAAALLGHVSLCQMSNFGNSSDADSSLHRQGAENISEKSHLSPDKLDSEISVDDTEVTSMEFNELDNSDVVGDDAIICEAPVNTCLDMQLEKPVVHGDDPCIPNGHVELADDSGSEAVGIALHSISCSSSR